MIDWLAFVANLDHTTNLTGGGHIRYSISPQGVAIPDWEKIIPRSVEGSFSQTTRVITSSEGKVYVDGNPSKFLQGHNLFGSDDLRALVPAFMHQICSRIGITPSEADIESWVDGNYELKRVDIARMYALPNRASVRSWIRAAELQSVSRHGRPIRTSGTVYWGKHSRRWSMKAYAKGDEISVPKHTLPVIIPYRDELTDYADNKLRIELVLRSTQLKEMGAGWGYNWTEGDSLRIHQTYLDTIKMSEQMTLNMDSLDGLPGRLQLVYQSWKRGDDLRAMLPKKTYYRYRTELLKHGIDINVQQVCDHSNVIPLIRALRPEAVTHVPEWALETPLYFKTA